jgi:hypothetical protein
MKSFVLYDYFELEVYFQGESTLPITVYCKRGNLVAAKTIFLKDGLLQSIKDNKVDNALDDSDQELFSQLVESNVAEIIKSWIDIYVYGIKKQPELIKNRLSSN